jgi:hypothetical protein
MEHHCPIQGPACCCRREFLRLLGASATLPLVSGSLLGAATPAAAASRPKAAAKVLGAFLYPPSDTLRQAGYWSWPGSGFDAEGRQRQYTAKLREVERRLGIELELAEKPLDEAGAVDGFIERVRAAKPAGLLLIPFKKSHWTPVARIVEETKVPAVILASLGILLVDHIAPYHGKTGVYLISAPDDLEAVAGGLRMVRAAHWMKSSRIINIQGKDAQTAAVPHLGTEVRTLPHARFVEEFARTGADAAVKGLARAYRKNARQIIGPTPDDILEAAKTYFAFKRILAAEQGDAVMMECLSGLQIPHQHVPPCLGFMSLRDEGIPAGCQSDLSATLTLMLVQQLFDLPGFQQNASMNTEQNLYFGAHCTAPSRMRGGSAPPEPYLLMHHAEAGWGAVPRVLFSAGQEVTMAQYVPGEKPRMIVYTGKVVRCPPIPPTGGCRSNLEMTINEVRDTCEVKGMHQIIFYGNHGRQLRAFCQLHGIEIV